MPREHDLAVLCQLWEAQQELADRPEPGGRLPGETHRTMLSWAGQKIEREEGLAFGPKIVSLYGSGYCDAERKACRRALDRLVGLGLVELSAPRGGNVSRAKLTAAGEELVLELLTQPREEDEP